MKPRFTFIVLIAVLAVILAACAPTPPVEPAASPQAVDAATAQPIEPTSAPTEPLVLIDALGREVTLAQPAQKIVSTAPSNTEILFAVGAGDQVIARDDFTNFPEEAVNLPSIGGMSGFNLEAITAQQPDLVLMAEINTPEDVKALEELGITVFMLPNPTDLEGLYTNLINVGKMTNHETEAAALVEDLKIRVDAVTQVMANVETRPTVFYELDGSDPAKPWTSGTGTFIDLLIGMAGGQNAVSIDSPWVQLSLEELIVTDPDFILLGDSTWGGVTPEMVAERAGWDALSAVENEKVLPFNDDLVGRPGPRLVEGLEELARILHPELMK